jgi:3-oxoadipate enol-lactonase
MTDPNIATEKTGTVEANGLSIGYSTRGSGPPLVLIHGAEAGREMFAAFAPELAAHFTVIAYDQRDTGSTRDLTIPPREYGLADMGDDVASLIKELGYGRAHVFGTSFGGLVAQVFAARHADCVDRLILSSTFMAGLGLMSLNPPVAQQMSVWRADPARYAPEIASKFFPATYLRAHPEWIDMFRGGRRTADQVARRARLSGAPYPIEAGEIRARTLLLMTAQDELIPNAATLAVAAILHEPRIEVIAGVGHIAAIQAPAELARVVVEFLTS